MPADRYFGAASEVLKTLKARVEANALDIARHGQPKNPFYVTGQVGGKSFSVHAEGERMFLRREDGKQEQVELTAPETPPAATEADEAKERPEEEKEASHEQS